MESLIKDHIKYFQELYIKTLNPICLEILKNLKGLYVRKDNRQPQDRKVVVKWC